MSDSRSRAWNLDDPLEHARYVASLDDCGGDCGYYFPGHNVHPIQARKSSTAESWPGLVTRIDGHWATLLFDDFGRAETVWHHRPVADMLSIGQLVYRRRYGLLAVPGEGEVTPLLSIRHAAGRRVGPDAPSP